LLGLMWKRRFQDMYSGCGLGGVGALLGPEGTTRGSGGVLWAVVAVSPVVGWWWWSAGVVVKCRVDASIFFLDL
jgi:hypothetical protein